MKNENKWERNYPLLHKNFEGATLPIVPVRIIDVVDDNFVIEFQSKKTTTVNQDDFIRFHKSVKLTEGKEDSLSIKKEMGSNEKIEIMWAWYESNVLNKTFDEDNLPF